MVNYLFNSYLSVCTLGMLIIAVDVRDESRVILGITLILGAAVVEMCSVKALIIFDGPGHLVKYGFCVSIITA